MRCRISEHEEEEDDEITTKSPAASPDTGRRWVESRRITLLIHVLCCWSIHGYITDMHLVIICPILSNTKTKEPLPLCRLLKLLAVP